MTITPRPTVSIDGLGLYELRTIADAVGKDGARFTLVAGLDEKLAAQLRAYSLNERDTDLQKNTSDRKRFGEGSYDEWFSKGRTPFALIAENRTLAAIAWFGPKPMGMKSAKHLSAAEEAAGRSAKAGDWHTVSYRCYGAFRGKGLMTGFVKFTIDEYLKTFPGAHLWLIAESGNAGSTALAEKLGFAPVKIPDADPAFVTMVRV